MSKLVCANIATIARKHYSVIFSYPNNFSDGCCCSKIGSCLAVLQMTKCTHMHYNFDQCNATDVMKTVWDWRWAHDCNKKRAKISFMTTNDENPPRAHPVFEFNVGRRLIAHHTLNAQFVPHVPAAAGKHQRRRSALNNGQFSKQQSNYILPFMHWYNCDEHV